MSDSLDSSEGAEKADERVAEVLPVMLELAMFAGPKVGEVTAATGGSDAVFEALDMVSMTSLSAGKKATKPCWFCGTGFQTCDARVSIVRVV